MKGLALVTAGLAALVLAGSVAAHPNEFELRMRVSLGLAPGPPGPAPPISRRASSRDVTVLGHADPGGGFNADVVAHKGYAYLGSWGTAIDEETYEAGTFCPAQGVRVYSLFNAANPTLVSTFADGASNPTLAGSWTEKVQVRHVRTRWFNGDLAAVSFQDCRLGGFTGIGLWDVTDPAHPVQLSLLPMGIFGVHELWLQPRGNSAYVYAAAIFDEVIQFFEGIDGDPEFRVVDVSNPRSPSVIGGWSAWKERGVEPVAGLGSFPFNLVHSVIGDESGKHAYVSYWDWGTAIFDMKDPANPRFLGRTAFASNEEGNAHSAWLAKGGNVLIQTDEDFDPGFFTPPGTEQSWGYAHFYDIKNPAQPRQLGTFKLPSTTQFPPPGPGDFTVHDPKVVGNTAYFSYYAEGVVAVDITHPARPSLMAQFVPEPAEDPMGLFFPGEAFPFVWGVYPERNVILASDINSGLWVFRIR